jgi:thioredoxin-dependent peroxiredoxin
MTAHPQPGDQAPDFGLPAGGADPLNLDALKGSKVVLYFYPKDDTDGCTAEAIAFNALRTKFARAQTRIIGISPDSAASHDKFKRKHRLALTLGSDETRTMVEAYGVWREKSMFGRKYMGVERTTVLIDRQGKIARIWRKVRVNGHAQEVLEAARAL